MNRPMGGVQLGGTTARGARLAWRAWRSRCSRCSLCQRHIGRLPVGSLLNLQTVPVSHTVDKGASSRRSSDLPRTAAWCLLLRDEIVSRCQTWPRFWDKRDLCTEGSGCGSVTKIARSSLAHEVKKTTMCAASGSI